MSSVIKEFIQPLVGLVQCPFEFNIKNPTHIRSLGREFKKGITNRDSKSLKNCLAFCLQHWSDFHQCEINNRLIDVAIKVIGNSDN